MRRLRVLTWHVHGSYLYYLAHVPHDLFVPVKEGRPPDYAGLPEGGFPWPENLHEVPAGDVRRLELDVVLSQTHAQWREERARLLSTAQQRLPAIHLEHDPPREHPVDQRHPVDDPRALLVHVTHFNALMWDSGRTPTRVVEHGVALHGDVRWSGELPRALALVNNLPLRGRRVGADVYRRVRESVPVDLVGLGSEGERGGLGEVSHAALPAFQARYRFLFNPIRYTSLGLAVCEAMMLGMPVVALGTTEHGVVVENGVNGYCDTNVDRLLERMQELLRDRAHAARLGEGARRTALARFGIERFVADWNAALALVAG
ncbi:MAG: glycosyltransferase family 4 protein [Thermoleophilia bacterium]|nr:glycosyltransferase family 4 protein [Thermoleophilia bacterium]